VRDAIDMRDLPAFTKAYSELTNACNACHRAAGHGFISVQVPAISPFTDQDFADQVAEGRKLAYTVCGVCHVVPDKPNTPLAMSFSAPSFVDLARRPSFTEATLRQLAGPSSFDIDQCMQRAVVEKSWQRWLRQLLSRALASLVT